MHPSKSAPVLHAFKGKVKLKWSGEYGSRSWIENVCKIVVAREQSGWDVKNKRMYTIEGWKTINEN